MPENKDTIIIPVVERIKRRLASLKPQDKGLLMIFVGYLVLLILIVFLPMENYLKVISLLLGSFILEDILHFKKAEASKYGSSN